MEDLVFLIDVEVQEFLKGFSLLIDGWLVQMRFSPQPSFREIIINIIHPGQELKGFDVIHKLWLFELLSLRVERAVVDIIEIRIHGYLLQAILKRNIVPNASNQL